MEVQIYMCICTYNKDIRNRILMRPLSYKYAVGSQISLSGH
jgi:hypothetical protein